MNPSISPHPPIVLSIAGSDSCAGAGIQADLKTFSYCGCHGLTVITAITAQNTINVESIQHTKKKLVYKQIETLTKDIKIQSVKTGMLGTKKIVNKVIEAIQTFNIPNLVVDPVLVATSGDLLISKKALNSIKEKLLPLSLIVTPNIHEASMLSGIKIKSIDDMKLAAEKIQKYNQRWVVIKGGDLPNNDSVITDIAYDGSNFVQFVLPKIIGNQFHGSGCSFSAAIVSYLALNYTPLDAIEKAKHTIYQFLQTAYPIGQSSLILNQLR